VWFNGPQWPVPGQRRAHQVGHGGRERIGRDAAEVADMPLRGEPRVVLPRRRFALREAQAKARFGVKPRVEKLTQLRRRSAVDQVDHLAGVPAYRAGLERKDVRVLSAQTLGRHHA